MNVENRHVPIQSVQHGSFTRVRTSLLTMELSPADCCMRLLLTEQIAVLENRYPVESCEHGTRELAMRQAGANVSIFWPNCWRVLRAN